VRVYKPLEGLDIFVIYACNNFGHIKILERDIVRINIFLRILD
jgi:hypothetical protein